MMDKVLKKEGKAYGIQNYNRYHLHNRIGEQGRLVRRDGGRKMIRRPGSRPRPKGSSHGRHKFERGPVIVDLDGRL